jgi:hypothetical protein
MSAQPQPLPKTLNDYTQPPAVKQPAEKAPAEKAPAEKRRPADENAFCQERYRLQRAEGRIVSDFQVSNLLGISRRHVCTLSCCEDREIRTCFLLALRYAARAGLQECAKIIEPDVEEFCQLAAEVNLTVGQTAMLLGLTAEAFRRLRSGESGLRLYHLLALREVHHHYGPSEDLAAIEQHAYRYSSFNHAA